MSQRPSACRRRASSPWRPSTRQFSLQPKGKYVVRVCDGTACHIKNSQKVYDALIKKLKLKDGRVTTADGLFTMETVACLGACGIAPVMVVNDIVHPGITPEAAGAIVETIIQGEAQPILDLSTPVRGQPMIANSSDLKQMQARLAEALQRERVRILVCAGTGCIANGALKVYDELVRLVQGTGSLVDIELLAEQQTIRGHAVVQTGCRGFCAAGPLVSIAAFRRSLHARASRRRRGYL